MLLSKEYSRHYVVRQSIIILEAKIPSILIQVLK
jgi:hypothetical protein